MGVTRLANFCVTGIIVGLLWFQVGQSDNLSRAIDVSAMLFFMIVRSCCSFSRCESTADVFVAPAEPMHHSHKIWPELRLSRNMCRQPPDLHALECTADS
jgi:hypothetical protein